MTLVPVWSRFVGPWARSLVLCLAGTAVSQAALIPVGPCADMVHDDTRGLLYVSASNRIERYSTVSNVFLPPIAIGTNLKGLDLSPDGSVLAAADEAVSATSLWVHLIYPSAGTNQQIHFPLRPFEVGSRAVVLGSDGDPIVSAGGGGGISGYTAIRRHDLDTGQSTNIAYTAYASMLGASGDRRRVALAEESLSSGYVGPVSLYNVPQNQSEGTAYTFARNYDVAMNYEGTQWTALLQANSQMYDRKFSNIWNVGSAASHPVGVAYHPTRDALFLAWGATNQIRVYNAFTRALLGSINTGQRMPTNATTLGPGRMRCSADGRLLFVVATNGVLWFTNTIAAPFYPYLTTTATPVQIGSVAPFGYGVTNLLEGTVVTARCAAATDLYGVRYRPAGFTLLGGTAISGTSSSVVFALTNHMHLSWHWAASDYRLLATNAGPGTVSSTGGWFTNGAPVTLTATPEPGRLFLRWVGDVADAVATQQVIEVTMDRARRVTALFAVDNGGFSSLYGDWPTFGKSSSHAGYFPGLLGRCSFHRIWTAGLTGSLNQVAVNNGRLFVTGVGLDLVSLRADTGGQRWRYTFSTANAINPPTYDAQSVYVQRCNHASDTHLWSFNADTGTTNWRTAHGAQFEAYMAPAVADGGIWVNGGQFGGLLGYDQATGSNRFHNTLLPQIDGWTPTYHDGHLFSFVAAVLREHDPMTGATLWTNPASSLSQKWNVPAGDGEAVYVASQTNFSRVDLLTRQTTWSVKGSPSRTPAVAHGIVYALTNTGVLAYRATDGSYLGRYAIASPLDQPIVTDDALIASSTTETRIFDLASFALRQVLPVGGRASLADGMLYVAGTTGTVHAFEAGFELVIRSAPSGVGQAAPHPLGTNGMTAGARITNTIPALADHLGTRYEAIGPTLVGDEMLGSDATSVVFVATNDALLVWNWRAIAHQLTVLGAGPGSVTNSHDDWPATNSLVTLTATASPGAHFVRWLGDVTPGQATQSTIQILMEGPRRATAVFALDTGTETSLVGDWPTYGRSPRHTGYFPGRLGLGSLSLRWTAVLTGSVYQVAVASGRVFAASSGWNLHALDAATGARIWHKNFGSGFAFNAPTYDDGGIFIRKCVVANPSTAQVWRLDAATGATNWIAGYQATWAASMPPTVAGGMVWSDGGYNPGGFYGFDQATGTQKFGIAFDNYEGWSPSYRDGRLFTFSDGRFRELNPTTGSNLWVLGFGSSGYSGYMNGRTIALESNLAIFTTFTNLCCVDVDARRVVWQVGGAYVRTPSVAHGLLYAITQTGLEVRVAASGQLFASKGISLTDDQPILTDDVLILSAVADVRILDRETLAVRQTLPGAGKLSLADGMLYVARTFGDLRAYEVTPAARIIVSHDATGTPGAPQPLGYGTNIVQRGSTNRSAVTSPWPLDEGTRLVCAGWTGTGDVPASGSDTAVVVIATGDSTLAWNWTTEYALATETEGSGTVDVAGGWFAAGATVLVTATAAPYYHLDHWSGIASSTSTTLAVAMVSPGTVTAHFAADLLVHNVPAWWLASFGLGTNDAAALADADADRLPTWREYEIGTDPTRRDTDGDGHWDATELARHRDPLDPSSRPSPDGVVDFDGDGLADLGVFHRRTAQWYVQSDLPPALQQQWGASDMTPVPGDYDGDGHTDFATYQASSGLWYVLRSSGGMAVQAWGTSDAKPVPGDYDGDGITDFATYRASSGLWQVLKSGSGSVEIAWGWQDARPVPADYDGDGITDLAVYHTASGRWHLLQSADGARSVPWGWSDAVPVPGDYDGDGRMDPAVYHPASGTWYLLQSKAGPREVQWGWYDAVPVPGDYDGDGITDLAVHHIQTGQWYILRSTGGLWQETWGWYDSVPVVAPFLRTEAIRRTR